MESFPETIEWFLDMKESRGSEGEVSTCSKTKHENLILSGSLKMFFFASESCNVRYSNNALVRCSMEDGIAGHRHCGGFTIPEASFNTNFLCAADDTILQFAKAIVWSRRLLMNWVEGLVVETVKCIAHPDQCSWEEYVDMTSDQVSATISQSLCNTYENTIKIANLFVAIISPALSLSYAASGHPTVQGGMSASDPGWILTAHASCSQYGAYESAPNVRQPSLTECKGLPPTTPAICATVRNDMSSHTDPQYHCVDVCETKTNAESCGGQCVWVTDGVAKPRCVRGLAPWTMHQSYPLEASLVTLMTSFINTGFFWPQYMAKTVYDTVMQALQLQAASVVCPDCVPPIPDPAPIQVDVSGLKTPYNLSIGEHPVPTDGASIDYRPMLIKADTTIESGASWHNISNLLKTPQAAPRRSSNVAATVKQDIRRLVMGVPNVLILNFIRDAVLPPRDIVMAFYEVVRACVYVADPNDLGSPDFTKFTLVRNNTVNYIQNVVK